MPRFFGKEVEKSSIIQNLGEIYKEIEKVQMIPIGDFPDLKKMQVCISVITKLKYFYSNSLKKDLRLVPKAWPMRVWTCQLRRKLSVHDCAVCVCADGQNLQFYNTI